VKLALRCTRFLAVLALVLGARVASAGVLPDHATVTKALREVVAEQNGGFGLQMWATIVDRDGIVRVVAMSGKDRGDQWPGSRVISAQKANTANAFSLPGLSIASGNLYFATQPGGSLFGLQASNPIDPAAAYSTSPALYGTANDPMVTKVIGGVNVFGGGLALYDEKGVLLGGLGLSGDSSVADHVIAWKLRKKLGLDYVPGGLSATKDDNLVIDIADGKSASGWGHAATTPEATKIVHDLPTTHPISKKK
jgi:uncharacterized protein GlcG (DUF336 family)